MVSLAINQFCRGFPNLGYTSCGRFDIIGMKGLNRINDYNFRLDRFNLFEDVLGFGFGKDVAVVTGRVILSALIFICFWLSSPETYKVL
jgi:hypothetical protein